MDSLAQKAILTLLVGRFIFSEVGIKNKVLKGT
jgi:hypothetical protein